MFFETKAVERCLNMIPYTEKMINLCINIPFVVVVDVTSTLARREHEGVYHIMILESSADLQRKCCNATT
jgi:hypothetical protein